MVAALMVITIALAAWLWSVIATAAPNTRFDDVMAVARGAPPSTGSVAWKAQNGSRINLLLMAKGGAEAGEDPNLTDTILLLAVGGAGRPVIVSLPRWMSASIPAPARGEIRGLLFTAYQLGSQGGNPHLNPRWRTPTGGGDLAAATVSALIGQPVDGWAVIDIDTFPALIDALGGIQVTVPAALDDPNYPVNDSPRTADVRFDAGPQWMNGERALEYTRSRMSTSDTDRSSRQELVLVAMLHRLNSLHIDLRMLRLVAAVRDGFRTSLRPADLQELNHLVSHLRLRDTLRLTIDDSNFLRKVAIAGDSYVLVPRDGTYNALRKYLATELAG